MKAVSPRGVTCDESFSGQDKLSFSFCNEFIVNNIDNESEEIEESVSIIYPVMKCETLLKGLSEFDGAVPGSSLKHSKLSYFPRLELKEANEPDPEHTSFEDQHSSFIVCQIKGSSSFPKIQRIYTNHSKAFLERTFQNTNVNKVEIISGSSLSLDDLLSRILPFEQSNRSSPKINIIDANRAKPDSSSDDDFNSLIDVIEMCEDPPSPIKRNRKKVSFSARKTTETLKKQTDNKNSKNICIGASDNTDSCRQSGVDTISANHQPLNLDETQMAPVDVQDLNTASEPHKRNQFVCDFCQNTFCSKYSVRDHILAKHPPSDNPLDSRAYKCQECPSAYVKKSALNQHIKMFHLNCPKFQCPSCPKSFKRKKYLEYHTLRAHSDTKGYLCQHCGASFSLIFALNEHVSYHHSGKAFKCNDCNKVYKKANSLIIHSKPRLEGQKPTCRYCKETFINKCSLQLHLQQVHEEMHQFFCQICDAKFTQKRCLLTHIKRVHHGVRKYPCPLCEKFFKTAAGVQVHLRHIHTNEKNFKCDLCCRQFKTKQIYNEHMAAKHTI